MLVHILSTILRHLYHSSLSSHIHFLDVEIEGFVDLRINFVCVDSVSWSI